jgi:hypothetical protein
VSRSLSMKSVWSLSEAIRGLKDLLVLNIDFENNSSSSRDLYAFFTAIKDLVLLKEVRLNLSSNYGGELSEEVGLSMR